jgi:hypothetical protein
MNMDLKEAVLAYMIVLGVPQYQKKLSYEEKQIGAENLVGCLHAIEDRLHEKKDKASISLLNVILERETLNGQIPDVTDPTLVASTRNCAEKVFDYYIKRCRQKE